jgi:hypothetical protein
MFIQQNYKDRDKDKDKDKCLQILQLKQQL